MYILFTKKLKTIKFKIKKTISYEYITIVTR